MCTSSERQEDGRADFISLTFYFTYRQEKKKKKSNADERKVRFVRVSPLNCILLCFGLFCVRVITGEEITRQEGLKKAEISLETQRD